MLDPNSREESQFPRPGEFGLFDINSSYLPDFDFELELCIAEVTNGVLKLLDNPDELYHSIASEVINFHEKSSVVHEARDREIYFLGLRRALDWSNYKLTGEDESADRLFRCFRAVGEAVRGFSDQSLDESKCAYGDLINGALEVACVLFDQIGDSEKRSADFVAGLSDISHALSVRSHFGRAPEHQQYSDEYAAVRQTVRDFIVSSIADYLSPSADRVFPDHYSTKEIDAVTAVAHLGADVGMVEERGEIFRFCRYINGWMERQPGALIWTTDLQETESPKASQLAPPTEEAQLYHKLEELHLELLRGFRNLVSVGKHDSFSQKVNKYFWHLVETHHCGWYGWGETLSTLAAISPDNVSRVNQELKEKLIEPYLIGEPLQARFFLQFMKDGRDQIEIVASIIRGIVPETAEEFYAELGKVPSPNSEGICGPHARHSDENAHNRLADKLEKLVSRASYLYFDDSGLPD